MAKLRLAALLVWCKREIPEGPAHPLCGEVASLGAPFAPTRIPWPGAGRADEAWLGSWDRSWFASRHLLAIISQHWLRRGPRWHTGWPDQWDAAAQPAADSLSQL